MSATSPTASYETEPTGPQVDGSRSLNQSRAHEATVASVTDAEATNHGHLKPTGYTKSYVDAHIRGLPNGVVLKCLNVFTNKFPELAVLHLPGFLEDFHSRKSKETSALLGAVLAVTRSQICVLNATWGDDLLPREHYASYTEDLLQGLILRHPKVQAVQALLIITLYEWGSRDFHKAWVYCGMDRLSCSRGFLC